MKKADWKHLQYLTLNVSRGSERRVNQLGVRGINCLRLMPILKKGEIEPTHQYKYERVYPDQLDLI